MFNDLQDLVDEVNKRCNKTLVLAESQKLKDGVKPEDIKKDKYGYTDVSDLLLKTNPVYGVSDLRQEGNVEILLESDSEYELKEKLNKILNNCFDPVI